ncbi:hypothetical protein AVEN_192401-1 [Araneus ventricosus]|uniref:Uncharacterized protein n=1 Tax=Araneus ventricosus TaxID=182803 RepID=A0A4Y2H4C0_ARAVE|nr:hypothetical protein AVEN_192401-1 [Araneus ventricosus]
MTIRTRPQYSSYCNGCHSESPSAKVRRVISVEVTVMITLRGTSDMWMRSHLISKRSVASEGGKINVCCRATTIPMRGRTSCRRGWAEAGDGHWDFT